MIAPDARQEAERAAEAESSRRTQERYGKDGEAFGRYEFTARTYEEGFEDGAAWQAAQPVVVSADVRDRIGALLADPYNATAEDDETADAILALLGITVETPKED